MKSVKILHCADLHFDTPFSGLVSSKKQEQRKEDLRETFGKIIDIIKAEKIQILLIAGDLFDNDMIMRTTILYLLNKFNEILDTHVFISPGNHDPLTEKSYYNIIKWPSNVHIFDHEMSCVLLKELNTCVYGVGFSKQSEPISLFRNIEDVDNNYINILLTHGELVHGGQQSTYNPITIESIENSCMDYVALGHTHEFSKIQKAGNVFWSYSGSIEGRGFDEIGSKGIIKGEIRKNSCSLQFQEVSKRKYFIKNIDITNLNTYEEIVNTVISNIDDKNKIDNLYKIVLEGSLDKHFCVNINVLNDKMKNYFYFVKFEDNTNYHIDFELLEKEYSLKGLFIKKILEKQKNTVDKKELDIINDAIKFGLKSLENEEVIIE